jgi:hypothetical protein
MRKVFISTEKTPTGKGMTMMRRRALEAKRANVLLAYGYACMRGGYAFGRWSG